MKLQTHHSHRSRIAHAPIGSLFLSLLLGIAPFALFAGSQLKSEPETVGTTVSFADLDLSTPAGVNTAHKRLVAAAQRLCRKFSDSRRVSDRETTAACFRETLADATQRFNASLATASAVGTDVARNTPPHIAPINSPR
jgi:UrcA family protein